MATALETSRRFARAYRLGSARARNRVTGAEPLGPSAFPVGGVSPESAVLKVAHAILASGAVRQRREMEQELAAREFEKSELELGKLRREAEEPRYSYTTPGGATVEGLTPAERVAAEDKFTTRTTGLPPAMVKLQRPVGRFTAGQEVDPRELAAELSGIRETGVRERAEKRGAATKRYTAAAAGLRTLKEKEEQAVEGAYALPGGFREYLASRVKMLSGSGAESKQAKTELGLPSTWNALSADNQAVLADRLKGLREAFESRMRARARRKFGPLREQYEQSIESEGATLMEQPEAEGNTFEDAILRALGGIGSAGAEGP